MVESSLRDLAYITYDDSEYPGDDADLPLVLDACSRHGLSVDAVIWDDPEVPWEQYRCAVLRSPWDYVEKYQHFRTWLREVDGRTRLLNPRAMVERNLDKTYLRELGLPIVPTTWVESAADLDRIDEVQEPWLVIKPTVSAGARDTIRTQDRTYARTHALKILGGGRSVMVQPYLDAVDQAGEISVICIDGTPSWAARKIPALTQGGHGGSKQAVPVSPSLREIALRALQTNPGSLYARVDVVEHEGEWVLMELELTEPSLFLPLAPEGADLLVSAIRKRLEMD